MKKPGVGVVSSSPGREKLPAPPGLARLLYGKAVGGSRSRGRSGSTAAAARSSPMFVSRSRSRGRSSSAAAAAAATEEGEPSSPKVTCIGQVRIRNKRLAKARKSPLPKQARTRSSLMVMPCRCFHKAFLCGLFPVRKQPPGGGGGKGGGRRRSLWRRWSCIRSGRSGRYQQRKQDPVRQPPQEFVTFSTKKSGREEDDGDVVDEKEGEAEEEEVAAHEGDANVFASSATASPPKNALLLMRCRSAPHNRASSLATARFAVSPVPSPDPASASPAPEDDGYQQHQQEMEREVSSGGCAAARVREAYAESTEEEEEEQADEANGSESRRPLVLPRSKSEPARGAAAKLGVPEATTSCFWPSHSNGGSRRRRSSPAEDDEASPVPAPPIGDT